MLVCGRVYCKALPTKKKPSVPQIGSHLEGTFHGPGSTSTEVTCPHLPSTPPLPNEPSRLLRLTLRLGRDETARERAFGRVQAFARNDGLEEFSRKGGPSSSV